MINFRLSAFVVLGSFMVAVGGISELRASPFDDSPFIGTWQGTLTTKFACFDPSDGCREPEKREHKLEFKIDPDGNLVAKIFDIGTDNSETLLRTMTFESTIPNFITTLRTLDASREWILKDVGPFGFSKYERYTLTINNWDARYTPKKLDDRIGTRFDSGQFRLAVRKARPDNLDYMETRARMMQHPIAVGFLGEETAGSLKRQPDSKSLPDLRSVK